MPTTIEWPCPANRGGQRYTFTWPKELKLYGYPTPPRQPASAYPSILQIAQDLMQSGDMEEAIAWMMAEYVYITTADLVTSITTGVAWHCGADGVRSFTDDPDGAPNTELQNLQDWISTNLTALPPCFGGPVTDWTWKGQPMQRSCE